MNDNNAINEIDKKIVNGVYEESLKEIKKEIDKISSNDVIIGYKGTSLPFSSNNPYMPGYIYVPYNPYIPLQMTDKISSITLESLWRAFAITKGLYFKKGILSRYAKAINNELFKKI